MKTSESQSEIYKALIAFQGKVESIPKNASNPFFKSKYAPLDTILKAIKQPLIDCGLGYVQFPVETGGLTTRLFHTSGEWMEDTYFMSPDKNTPQGLGAVITYQRRYALGAILGLDIDDDDDGNEASKKKPGEPAADSNSQEDGKSWLHPGTEKWEKAVAWLSRNTDKGVKGLFQWYKISKDNQKILGEKLESFKEIANGSK